MAQWSNRFAMADSPKKQAASPTPPPAKMSEPEIHTIPEQFYGAALRAKIAPAEGAMSVPKSGKRHLPVLSLVVGGLLVLAGITGGFVYFNQDLLFPPAPVSVPPTPEPPPPPPPPPIPDAPQNLTATSTAPQSVSLSWTDASDNESGFRVERRESASSYAPITSVPPNATAFLDGSVQADTSYLYRVTALGAGGDSEPSNEVTVRTQALPPPPPVVPTLPPAGLDSDSDGLTDLEEPLYGSPLRDPDADKDSFLDGNEVFHLYSPSGKAPGKLLESGLVKEFQSPVGWNIYVPTSWQVRLEENGRVGTILTGHGEIFRVSLEDNPSGQPIMDWYLAKNPGVLSSQVQAIQTKSGFDGIEGADQLTTYIPWGDRVFIIRYDLDDQPFVNFRTTYEMMKNSLALTLAPTGLSPIAAPADEADSAGADPIIGPNPASAGATASSSEEGDTP